MRDGGGAGGGVGVFPEDLVLSVETGSVFVVDLSLATAVGGGGALDVVVDAAGTGADASVPLLVFAPSSPPRVVPTFLLRALASFAGNGDEADTAVGGAGATSPYHHGTTADGDCQPYLSMFTP